MTRYGRALCAWAVIGGAVAAGTHLNGQSAVQIGAAPVTHIGVVVRDIEEATRHFADVVGMQPLQIRTIQIDLPDKKQAEIKRATAQLPNLRIEFDQPVTESGPIYDHLQKIGQGIHRMGFAVEDGVDEKRAFLEQQGGTWTAGITGGTYAFVDLKDTLGTTIEIVQQAAAPTGPTAVPPTSPAPLSLRAVRHVGIAVDDTNKVAKAFADILGVPPPTVRDYKDAQYPPGHPWSMDAYIRLTSWRHPNLGIELLGAVGKPNPWSDYVDRFKGSTVQHVSLPVGPRMGEIIPKLQQKGGTWTNGGEGGTYAYLDFVDSFGLAFELNGTVAR